MDGIWRRYTRLAIGVLGCALFAGCASCRLPAIDPSGDRLFLPGGSTTLESCAPKPAFTKPPKPAPCPAGTLGHQAPVAYAPGAPSAPCGTGAAAVPGAATNQLVGGRSQLKATPARLVAPVGSEVVIVAGYCDGDGFFTTKEPLEWTLAQDSVGHFLEIGSGAHPTLQKFFHDSPDKRSSNYALNRTFTEGRVLTRGTPNRNDDVRVAKGQAYISLTSPTEGTSHVTVVAPEIEDWTRRRQTSTIHWIDAQWQFPGPVAAATGQPVALVTSTTRATNGSPLIGWIVRYSVAENANAAFANGGHEIEVLTDESGQAMAELASRTGEGGIVPVTIQIIRPSQASGDLPKTVVGNGSTTVTWSAPGLGLRVLGPESVPVGQNATFRIEVTNQGDLPARDVVVSDALPPNLKFVSSNPPGQSFGDRMEWHLGDLAPRITRPIDVTAQAVRAGDVRYCVKARGANGLASESCLDRLRIQAPVLQLEVFGPNAADVGTEVPFRIRITNRGANLLRNVQLMDTFDAGFSHVQGQRSPMTLPVGDLAAGDVREVTVTFVVRQAGTICHTVQAFAEGGQVSTMRSCLAARDVPGGAAGGAGGAAPSPFRIQLTGPRQGTVNQAGRYEFSVQNTGNQILSNVRVAFNFDPSIEATEASGTFNTVRGTLSWNVGTLARGARQDFIVVGRFIAETQAATVRVTATGDPATAGSESFSTVVGPAAGGAPGGAKPAERDTAAADPSVTGQLTISVADTDNPVRLGQATRYIIVIKNERNASDRNVMLSFRLSENVDVSKIRTTGPTRNPKVSGDGRTWQFEPVAEIRAGEALVPYTIEVKPLAAGRISIEVEVTSWRSPNPIRETKETTVTTQ